MTILGPMSTRERAIDRGRRLATQDRQRLGTELRSARMIAGRSLDDVGPAAGMSPSTAGRIERGVLRAVTIDQSARLGAVLGLDIRVRAYPGSSDLRDAGQLAVGERLRGRLHVSLTFRSEQPLPIPGDQRAWDGWIGGLGDGPHGVDSMPCEIETRLVDIQAQTRRIMLKLRDSGHVHVLLVVADTGRNRDAIKAAESALAELFPLSTREVLRALADGRHPGASGLVVI